MIFRLIFQNRLEPEAVKAGVFFCPRCEVRRPCAHVRMVSTVRLLGLLPLGPSAPVSEGVVCSVCEDANPPENYTFNEATGSFDLAHWECSFCKQENPNTIFRCRGCARSLV